MLFFLTGEIQTGKTRWLQNAIKELMDGGVEVAGLISPGVWREEIDGQTGGTTYVKEGIDVELLPSGERFPFAIPRDVAREQGTYDENSQSARAGLDWAIDEDALARANAYLDMIDARVAPSPLFLTPTSPSPFMTQKEPDRKSLIVIDELGQMELLRSLGLQSAIRLLNRGKTSRYPHALVVVRKSLLDTASSYFIKTKWGGMVPIYPTDESLQSLLHVYGLADAPEEHNEPVVGMSATPMFR